MTEEWSLRGRTPVVDKVQLEKASKKTRRERERMRRVKMSSGL